MNNPTASTLALLSPVLRCAIAAGVAPTDEPFNARMTTACDAVLAIGAPPPGYNASTLAAAKLSAEQAKARLAAT